MFDSIMNSLRRFEETRLCSKSSNVILNEQQGERIIEILKKYGSNITDLELSGVALPVDNTIKLWRGIPKLKTLQFYKGEIIGNANDEMLELPRLKDLRTGRANGFFKIINLLPAGTVTSYCSNDGGYKKNDHLPFKMMEVQTC